MRNSEVVTFPNSWCWQGRTLGPEGDVFIRNSIPSSEPSWVWQMLRYYRNWKGQAEGQLIESKHLSTSFVLTKLLVNKGRREILDILLSTSSWTFQVREHCPHFRISAQVHHCEMLWDRLPSTILHYLFEQSHSNPCNVIVSNITNVLHGAEQNMKNANSETKINHCLCSLRISFLGFLCRLIQSFSFVSIEVWLPFFVSAGSLFLCPVQVRYNVFQCAFFVCSLWVDYVWPRSIIVYGTKMHRVLLNVMCCQNYI